MQSFTNKQPYESYAISFDFSSVIGEATIASATIVAADQSGDIDVTDSLLDNGQLILRDTLVYGWVQNGETGHNYIITCRVVATHGSQYELDGSLSVVEVFAADYLTRAPTVSEFIEEYPGFAATSSTAISIALLRSSQLLDSSSWGDFYNEAVSLDVAHSLTLSLQAASDPSGGFQVAVGPVNSVSAAGVSTGFSAFDTMAGSKSDSWYAKTVYGQRFLRLRDNIMLLGAMCA